MLSLIELLVLRVVMSLCLTNHFLVATQSLRGDDYFERSVIYIYESDVNGTKGFIVNRPIEVEFTALLKHLNIEMSDEHDRGSLIYLGGPAQQDVGTLLYTREAEVKSSCKIIADSSRDNLEAMLNNKTLNNFIFVLGHSVWLPNQLESELVEDKWLVVPADARIIFDTPSVPERWSKAAKLIGVDQVHLMESGNA
jgi:putative transcriptional regulator